MKKNNKKPGFKPGMLLFYKLTGLQRQEVNFSFLFKIIISKTRRIT